MDPDDVLFGYAKSEITFLPVRAFFNRNLSIHA
jgi:hypothetical protein